MSGDISSFFKLEHLIPIQKQVNKKPRMLLRRALRTTLMCCPFRFTKRNRPNTSTQLNRHTTSKLRYLRIHFAIQILSNRSTFFIRSFDVSLIRESEKQWTARVSIRLSRKGCNNSVTLALGFHALSFEPNNQNNWKCKVSLTAMSKKLLRSEMS